MSLQEMQNLIFRLSPAEKALVLQWVTKDWQGAYAGIEERPNINGGEVCVVRTRVPVWLLVALRRAGASEADLLRDYPSLRAEDLTNTWAFAAMHKEQIEQDIILNEAA